MVIKAKYNGRDIQFSDGSHLGSGLSDLLSRLGKNKDKVTLLTIDGQTGSYTFERQIYLLANVFSTISGSKVKINGKEVSRNKVILPVYGS